MKTFNVENQTETVGEFNFAGAQKARFEKYKCERVFRFRYLAGDIRRLPKYVVSEIIGAGYFPVCIGGTALSHSVVGLVPINKIEKIDRYFYV